MLLVCLAAGATADDINVGDDRPYDPGLRLLKPQYLPELPLWCDHDGDDIPTGVEASCWSDPNDEDSTPESVGFERFSYVDLTLGGEPGGYTMELNGYWGAYPTGLTHAECIQCEIWAGIDENGYMWKWLMQEGGEDDILEAIYGGQADVLYLYGEHWDTAWFIPNPDTSRFTMMLMDYDDETFDWTYDFSPAAIAVNAAVSISGPASPTRGDAATYQIVNESSGYTVLTTSWSSNQTAATAVGPSWNGTMVADTVISAQVYLECDHCGGLVTRNATLPVDVADRTGAPWNQTLVLGPVYDSFTNYYPTSGHDLARSQCAVGPLDGQEQQMTRYYGSPTAQQVSAGPNAGVWYLTYSTLVYVFQVYRNTELTNIPSLFSTNQGGPGEPTIEQIQAAVQLHEVSGTPSHLKKFVAGAATPNGNMSRNIERVTGPSNISESTFISYYVQPLMTTSWNAAQAYWIEAGEHTSYLPPGTQIDFYPYY